MGVVSATRRLTVCDAKVVATKEWTSLNAIVRNLKGLFKMKCGIIIVDTEPLKTLAYGDSLNLLLLSGIPVYVSDMVIDELRKESQLIGNVKALEFIEGHLSNGVEIIKTGVPEIFDKLKDLCVDPGDESIRRIINRYEDENDGEYGLLVSEDHKFIRTADPLGRTYVMTTCTFLQDLKNRNIIKDAESILIKAEEKA